MPTDIAYHVAASCRTALQETMPTISWTNSLSPGGITENTSLKFPLHPAAELLQQQKDGVYLLWDRFSVGSWPLVLTVVAYIAIQLLAWINSRMASSAGRDERGSAVFPNVMNYESIMKEADELLTKVANAHSDTNDIEKETRLRSEALMSKTAQFIKEKGGTPHERKVLKETMDYLKLRLSQAAPSELGVTGSPGLLVIQASYFPESFSSSSRWRCSRACSFSNSPLVEGARMRRELDGADVQHGSGAAVAPSHAGPLHTILDQVAAGSLDNAGRDRIAFPQVFVIRMR